ncbi:MAG: hypothetical protein NC245_01310 [Muribaculum sp.]|nr:hypothetical protein [Muribaculum sp.]
MKYLRAINGRTVYFQGEESLKDVAEFFFDVLQQEDQAFHMIKNDNVIQIGWGFYKIRQSDYAYQILACDLSGNPFQDMTEDLTLSLEIFDRQRRLLKATGAAPQETSFQDSMIVQRAAVKASRVYLQRCEPSAPNDSGWYMGIPGEKAPEDSHEYARIYTYQLLRFCREAVYAIQLPTGTVCVLEDGRLIEAMDRDNNKIY